MTHPSNATALLRRAVLLFGLITLAPGGVALAHDRDRDRDENRDEWAEHVRPQAATARLLVVNDAGSTVQLRLDGRPAGSLAPGQARQLVAPVGSHRVEATYVQLGVERSLRASSVRLSRGERRQVRLQPPTDSLVAVRNPLDRPVQLRIDGRLRGSLAPYERQLVAVDLGLARLELLVDGRVVDSDQRRVQAFAGMIWTPQPAMVGDVVVVNPLPIPVTLTCSRGFVRTVPAYGRTTYSEVNAGVFSLTVRRADGGETIGTLRPTVRAFERAQASVPQPSRGVVELVNPRRRAVQVFLDGRLLTTLTSGETERLLVRPGSHQLELIAVQTGRTLERRSLRVDRYEVAFVDVPQGGRQGPALSLGVDDDFAWLDLSWGSDSFFDEDEVVASSSTCSMR